MKRYCFVVLALALLGLSSCKTANSLVKKGIKFEESGLFADAAEFYYQALLKKQTNIDAKIGLQRCGQQVVETKLNAFENVYVSGDNERAVELYQNTDSYYKRMKRVGVELVIPNEYTQQYEDAKNVFINEKYAEGSKYLEQENFKGAADAFQQIVALKADFKDTRTKLQIAICEPLYRTAVSLMNNGHFRSAYATIEQIQKKYDTYKDIIDLKTVCLENGRLTVVVPMVRSGRQNRERAEAVRSLLVQSITSLNSPFIDIYIDVRDAQSNGQMVVLDATLSRYEFIKEPPMTREERGWLRRIEKKDNEKVTVYDKVIYYVTTQRCMLKLKLTGTLIDASNGNHLSTNTYDNVLTDEICFGEFDGNYKNLVQGHWRKPGDRDSREEYVEDNTKANQMIADLFQSRRKLLTQNDLLKEMMYEVSAPYVDAIANILAND